MYFCHVLISVELRMSVLLLSAARDAPRALLDNMSEGERKKRRLEM